MKPVLFVAAAIAALSSVPAFAQNGQVFDHAAQLRAFSSETPRDVSRQCFNGKFIAGANRSGDSTLYVQSAQGGIYRVKLAAGCDALNGAQRIGLRANGSDVVCPGDAVEMVVQTAAGSRRCNVADVSRLKSSEAAMLSGAARR